MGEALHVVRAQPHQLQQSDDLVSQVLTVARQVMNDERLADDAADRMAGVERGERVLEDDLHLAPQGPQRGALERRHVGAGEVDLAVRAVDQPHDAAAGGGFPAPGFADQPECLSGMDVKAHTIDGMDAIDLAGQHAALDREVLFEIAN